MKTITDLRKNLQRRYNKSWLNCCLCFPEQTGQFLKHYIEIYLREKMENILFETLEVQQTQLNEENRRDFLNAEKYVMTFFLTEDPSSESKIKITDKLLTSVTDSVVSKRTLKTSIAPQVRCTVVEEISNMEAEVISSQQWKAKTVLEKSKVVQRPVRRR